ncbi:MAG: hypothetical protein AAFR01_04045 [Pseudomonadota bacterium]
MSTRTDDTPENRRGERTTKGGRPSLPLEQRRTERVSFGVTKTQKAAFLINAAHAGLSSNDYARTVLCASDARAGVGATRAAEFELVDALNRIGTDLSRLLFIADDTGVVPGELEAVISRLDRKLDHLIVGTRIAEELAEHRDRLQQLTDRLDSSEQINARTAERVRGIVRTFDAVVTKVLSA